MPPSPPARRSTRGAPPAAPASTTSSTISSTRQDRNVRGTNNAKSATPRSLSSEDISEPPRRSQRSQVAHKDDDPSKTEDAVEDPDEEAMDEDEITRCICGLQEYPGPPLSEAFAGLPDAQAEDAGELFILCDGCSVWQHGGCVGIVAENLTPEKYFCERCRPKLHALGTDSRGQSYSLYLPLHPKASTRKNSVSKPDDKARKERESLASRASVDPATGKRRATMRSKEHDEEEEQIRIAIERSTREVSSKGGTGRRNGKRTRDDSSEESKSDHKRQRRSSESIPLAARNISPHTEDSEDQTTGKGKAKRELLEKREQEKERTRSEAAGRRQERARSRRGGDDPEQAEETNPEPTLNAKASPPPPSSQPPSPPAAEKTTYRKGPGKKPAKKLGNNQYTKAKLEQAAASPHGRKKTLNQPPGSGDETTENLTNGDNNGSKQSPGAPEVPTGTGKGKFGRGKKTANGNGVKADNEPVERTFTNMQAALVSMSAYVERHKADTEHLQSASVQPLGSDATPSSDRSGEGQSAFEMGLSLQKNIEVWQRQWGHLAGSGGTVS